MAQQCANWESCMNRDPTAIGRAKVGAELIAEVINGFVEPITWKTLVRKRLVLMSFQLALRIVLVDFYIDFTGLLNRFHQHPTLSLSRQASTYLRNTAASNPTVSHCARKPVP